MTPLNDSDAQRRYLLGRLPPEVQAGLEARLLSNDQVFWERLSLEEEQLIDEYAADRLDNETREDFERHFLSTEERRAKLAFVRALQAYANSQHERTGVLDWLRRPVLAPRWALAVAATILLALPTAVWHVAGGGPAAGDDVRVWLSSDLVRAGGTIARVRVVEGCRTIHLQLDPGSVTYASYRATLHEVTGEERLSQGQLQASTIDNRPAVTLTIPCEALPEGDYHVQLHGLAPGAAPVVLQRAHVRVLHE